LSLARDFGSVTGISTTHQRFALHGFCSREGIFGGAVWIGCVAVVPSLVPYRWSFSITHL